MYIQILLCQRSCSCNFAILLFCCVTNYYIIILIWLTYVCIHRQTFIDELKYWKWIYLFETMISNGSSLRNCISCEHSLENSPSCRIPSLCIIYFIEFDDALNPVPHNYKYTYINNRQYKNTGYCIRHTHIVYIHCTCNATPATCNPIYQAQYDKSMGSFHKIKCLRIHRPK